MEPSAEAGNPTETQRDPQFRLIGVPMGICRRHEHYVGKGRMHVLVDPPRSG